MATSNNTQDLIDAVQPYVADDVVVGYSGGLDSHVLLHLLASYFPQINLTAVHVNHQQSPHAAAWAAHTQAVCAALGVTYRCCCIEPVIPPGESVEAVLRDARFAALTSALPNENSALLLAHHADDQAETVLLRLLRGAGPTGLGAMQPIRGQIRRPLLSLTRAQLRAYADEQQLQWIEDESNRDVRYDRNYLRQRVMPLLKERWPGLHKSLGRTAALCQETDGLLAECAQADGVGRANPLNWQPLQSLSLARQSNAIRYWLQQLGVLSPSLAQLRDFLQQLGIAAADKTPTLFLTDHVLRLYRQQLYCTPKVFHFELVVREAVGEGLSQTKVKQPLQVATRTGGETIKLSQGGCHQRLKNCWQQWGVPPWLRDDYPLIFQDGQLIAVPGYAYHADYVAGPGEAGWLVTV